MSAFLLSLVCASAAGGWVYSRLHRTTGGNHKHAISGSLIVGILTLIIAYSLIRMFIPS